jgi:predicted transcriptional regulator
MVLTHPINAHAKVCLSSYDWLYSEYVTLEKKIDTIASELGVSYDSVSRAMKKLNMQHRTSKGRKPTDATRQKQSETWIKNHGTKLYHDKQWLYDQYIINHRSLNEIASDIDCHALTIRYWLMKYGIKIRTVSEAVDGEYNHFYGKHHTEKTKQEHSERMSGENNPNYGKSMSDEQKAKISKTRTGKCVGEDNPFYGKKHTPEELALMSEHRKGKLVGPDNPTYGKPRPLETRLLIGEKSRQFWSNPENHERMLTILRSAENRDKQSKIMLERWINGAYKDLRPHGYGKGDWYTRLDGSVIWLKSSYEIRVAKVLDSLNIPWTYESKTFCLSNGHSYRPDFLINDTVWWEVKGLLDDDNRDKMLLFFSDYPDIDLRMIWLKDIIQLENSDEINLYEFGSPDLDAEK